MKIKVFTSTSAGTLEDDINDFVRVREVINIQFSTTHRDSMNIVYSALITYK